MTRELIEDFREIVLPFVKKVLLKTNYENLGKSDAEEFEKHFNEILDLAIQALEQEPILVKIRAEIEQTVSRYSISRERGGIGQVEWSDRLIKESEVLQILNKYKAEEGEESGKYCLSDVEKMEKIEQIVHEWSDIELGSNAEKFMGLIQELVEDADRENGG